MDRPAENPSPSLPCRFTRRHRIDGGEGGFSRRLAALLRIGRIGFIALLLSCSNDERLSGGSSETETGTATGQLVLKGGAAVQGARVTLFPAGDDSGKAAGGSRIAFTDASGAYRFDSLRFDTYNMTALYIPAGTKDTLAASRLRIPVTKVGRNVKIGVDTLRGPGAVSARVMFLSNPVEEALCYVPGTSYLAVTDSGGRCLVSGIPPGRYRLSFKAAGYLTTRAPDSVRVSTDDTVRLGDVQLQLDDNLAPPKPNGLKISFDSASRTVTLQWSKVPAKDLEGYALYRDSVSAVDFTRLTPDRLVKDTVFIDSLKGLKPGVSTLLAYRIKAQDQSGEQSGFGLFETVRVSLPTVPTVPRVNRPPMEPWFGLPSGDSGVAWPVTLRWRSKDYDGDPIKADIYMGKDLAIYTRIAQGVEDSLYVVDSLEPQTTYWWRVILTDGKDTVEGPGWKFTTGKPPAEGWMQLGNTQLQAGDMCFINKDMGWITGPPGKIAHTTDGGRSWTQQSSGTQVWLSAIQFTDSQHGWAVGDSTTILRTQDGGAHWTPIKHPAKAWFWDLFFLDSLHGWVVGQNTQAGAIVLKTNDGGMTWKEQVVENSSITYSIHFLNADTGYITGLGWPQASVHRTIDGGDHWEKLDFEGIFAAHSIYFINADTGWVGGEIANPDYFEGRVARTVDGGRHWTIAEIPSTASINSVGFQDGNTGWAAGRSMYKTLDGGRTWQPEPAENPHGFFTYFSLDRDHGWAAGPNGTFFQRPPVPTP